MYFFLLMICPNKTRKMRNGKIKMNPKKTWLENKLGNSRTNHIMWTMGEDNRYANANLWYKNIDKLIHAVNSNATNGIYMFYSSPDCYTQAKHEANVTWNVNHYDYMPLRDDKGYWTGFYSSRSNYKGYVRETYSLLRYHSFEIKRRRLFSKFWQKCWNEKGSFDFHIRNVWNDKGQFTVIELFIFY